MQTSSSTAADKAAIAEVVQGWALWRDSCDWARLRDCFAPGARIRTTWFDGSAEDFVAASIRLALGPGSVSHFVGSPVTELAGDRALAETRVALHVRGTLDGTVVDVQCLGRFHDRFERHGNGWKMVLRVPVYDKDGMAAVQPGAALLLDAARLAALPAHYAHLAYLQSSGGAVITPDLPAANSPAYLALHEASRRWLHKEPA